MAPAKSVVAEVCDIRCCQELRFWRAVAAEMLGTFLFLFILLSSTISWNDQTPTILQISFAAGLAIATLVQCFGHISGGHLNPAVTVAMLFTGKIGVFKSLFYIIAQCVGAIGGAALVFGVTPEEVRGNMGANVLNAYVTAIQGFGIEFTLTFILVFTVFATTDERNEISGSKPLAIGIAVIIAHLVGIGYTSVGINPARTLGASVMMKMFDDHWVFWAGPLGGGVAAGWIYVFTFGRQFDTEKRETESEKYTEHHKYLESISMDSANDRSTFVVEDAPGVKVDTVNLSNEVTTL
ncbi:aquaporin [Saccoglossus kowalevskii]|uniref:Aquaporin n=1 Tax=Saccoglossus kowalevskii TaxID=10224 RepID=B5THM7_SACKO|nr:aquaporin [Saccoglossus kowalevskii]ACH73235.1 aquaporin protein [Saccoglossus kowalevskii]